MSEGLFGRLQEEIELQRQDAGMTQADQLELPAPLRKIANLLARRRVMTLQELVQEIGDPEDDIRPRLVELVAKTYVREMRVKGELTYKIVWARKRGRQVSLDVWDALEEKVE